LLRTGRVQCIVRYYSRRAHHVENPGYEAEKQKHDHPPRRDSQPAINQPADGRTDHDRGHELGREPKTAGDRCRIGRRTVTGVAFGRTIGLDLAEPLAETLKPRGERRLVGRELFAITFFACVVGNAFDTRDGSGKITVVPPPKPRGPY